MFMCNRVKNAGPSIDETSVKARRLRTAGVVDSAHGSAVAGHFLGKLHTRGDAQLRVHVREMGLHRPPGDE
jgi:hypothetical protein